jgi:hypothetical protein
MAAASVPEYAREWEGKRVEIAAFRPGVVPYDPRPKRGLVIAATMRTDEDGERVVYARIVREDGFVDVVDTHALTKLAED